MKYKLSIFADYFQFYLEDEGIESNSDIWNDETVQEQLAVAPGIIAIGTVRNMEVPVEIEISKDVPSNEDFAQWDKIKECSVKLSSGTLVVLGCSDYYPNAFRIKLEPRCYRSRIYYGGLSTITNDGLEGDDHYKIILWPDEFIEPFTIK